MARLYGIDDYGLIGNCETAALVNPDGGIDWLCLPAFDSPSLFGALLDRERGGEFTLRPVGDYRVERRYCGDTAILETRFTSEHGTVKLTDFFVIARTSKARFYNFTSLHPTRKLVRLVQIERGDPVPMDARIAARPDYARRGPDWRRVEGGFACSDAALFSNVPLVASDGCLTHRFALGKDDTVYFVLDYAESREPPDLPRVRSWLRITHAFWSEWNLFNYYRGPHQKLVRRSAVTLKMLTYAPSGAILAAPTTSLPEKLGGDLNWDYRFTWVRDTALLINVLFRLGYSGEAKAFFEFIAAQNESGKEEGGALPVLLPIRAETEVVEESLEHLAGYRDSRPVRRGNRAEDQLQLDNYGHFLQSLLYWTHTGGRLDATKQRIASDALEFLRQHWEQPDNGIWEPTERVQHTYGKVSAWLGFERAKQLGLISAADAEVLCRDIHAQVMDRGLGGGGKYLADRYEADSIGATALLAFTTGFLPADVARSTREEIERRLAAGPWVFRSEAHRATGEGAFVLCSCWRIGHLIREGELARARRLLEQVLAARSPLGLYSEEIDPASGEFLGNFPQAFSHVGLISTLLNLEQAEKKPAFAAAPDHEKFQQSVGPTIGFRGVIAGFWRVPRTLRLLFSRRSKWRERAPRS